jgi:hypothetical protein
MEQWMRRSMMAVGDSLGSLFRFALVPWIRFNLGEILHDGFNLTL